MDLDYHYTICEPIIHISGYSMLDQAPFKIYKICYHLDNDMIEAKYFYKDVNLNYKPRRVRYQGKIQTYVDSPFYKFVKPDMDKSGVLIERFSPQNIGRGMWLLRMFLKTNICFSGNSVSDGKAYLYGSFKSENGSLMYQVRNYDPVRIDSLDVEVLVIRNITIIGSGKAEISTTHLNRRKHWTYRKARKTLKEFLMKRAGTNISVFTTYLERALQKSYISVGKNISALNKSTKQAYIKDSNND